MKDLGDFQEHTISQLPRRELQICLKLKLFTLGEVGLFKGPPVHYKLRKYILLFGI